jgi:hypothetical protein
MAGLLAQQGHWQEAAEAYRYLVRRHPEREDLVAALAEAERRAQAPFPARAADLEPLFAEWVGMMSAVQRMRRLRRFLSERRGIPP